MATCALCNCIHETFRVITKTPHSFCVVVKETLKEGHVMVLPQRHTESFSQLNPIEAKDLLDLVEIMRSRLNHFFQEDVLIVRNTGVHSTQPHIHIHLIPSKGSLRDLIGKYENIPARPQRSDEEYVHFCNQLKF